MPAAIVLFALPTGADAAMVYVEKFGDQGWRSDDTRLPIGGANDLVGVVSTHAGKPGQAPSAAHDALIADQIKFVKGPAGSTYGDGAVVMHGTANGNGKSNISVISPGAGFAAAADLLDPDFFVKYDMYKQHTGSGSTLAFKLGIQSTDWGTAAGESQNGFTAVRSGESVWDLVLVHVPTVANNVWTEINLDHDTGTWTLFRQAGNAFFPPPPPNGGLGSAKTLDDWALDAYWGPKLFGSGAKVSSVQFGLGSGQPLALGYVDYVQTSLLNGGDPINFVTMPEPATLSLLAMGGAAMLRRRRLA